MKKIALILLISFASAITTKAKNTDYSPPANVVGHCTQLALNTSHGDYDVYKATFDQYIKTYQQ